MKRIEIGADGHRVDCYRDEDGLPRCHAKKRGGGRCRSFPIKGMTKCRLHGGKSLKGPASATFKTGAQSAWMASLGIPPMTEDDFSMLDVRHGIAVQEKVIEGMARRLNENDSPDFRKRAAALVAALRATIVEGDEKQVQEALRLLQHWVTKGVAEDRALEGLSDAAAKLSNQIHGAHKVRLSAKNVVPAEDLTRFMLAMVAMVREECGGAEAARVLARVDREILGGRLGRPGEGGAGAGRTVEVEGAVAAGVPEPTA